MPDRPLKVLFLSAEVAPLAKVGGLADVAGSLPTSLRELGHDVRIAMPAYPMAVERLGDPTRLVRFDVTVSPGWEEKATATWGTLPDTDTPIALIGNDRFFQAGRSSAGVYTPGHEQYLFFSRAAIEMCKGEGWLPDIVHANDWHMGLTAPLLRHRGDLAGAACVFTIHNLAYQGEFDVSLLDEAGLPREWFHPDALEAYGRVNFLKAGCAFSERTNTVSERYAQEITTPEFGCGLDGFMAKLAREDRLSGILNGINLQHFDPETDPALARNYSTDDLSGKAACRAALEAELGWAPSPMMTMGVVSRLSDQKGIDRIVRGADALFKMPVRLVIQGLGDPHLAKSLTELQSRYPAQFRFVEKFDEPLAQRIYAGCDAFLMPSAFEPCGLGQMIALRYGTLPIVRETGGLADTIKEGVNGFVFQERSDEALLEATARAANCFGSAAWTNMVRTAMAHPFGWVRSATKYVSLYDSAIRCVRTSE